MTERTLQVDYLARVEGEGAMTLVMKDGAVQDVRLRIFEPPRFFVGFLLGREAVEAPDITARICGICPVAYQMSACQAVEDAFGLTLPPELAVLRRALYCGEWIESHALHMVLLHAPDFLGFPDAMTMAREHGAQVKAGLAVKKAGNGLVTALGGREIHPVNVRIGGFWRLPRKAELRAAVAALTAARPLAMDLLGWFAGFEFPPLERAPTLLALTGDEYPLQGGAVASTLGHRFAAAQWGEHVVEEHVERSNALHARLDGGAYLTGPAARFALNFDRLPEELKQASARVGLEPLVTNPFRWLLVRAVETVFAIDEAIAILTAWDGAAAPSVPVVPRAGVGHGVTEAPRGVLYHRYETADDGSIVHADIVPPTAQNQLAIEDDLRALAPSLAPMDDAAATHRAEQAIRNYDPCISCATHFLTLTREQG